LTFAKANHWQSGHWRWCSEGLKSPHSRRSSSGSVLISRASAAKVGKEPTAEVAKPCCVRSQRENLLSHRENAAASQRLMRPFSQYAANLKP
jgi:hypothetical protein